LLNVTIKNYTHLPPTVSNTINNMHIKFNDSLDQFFFIPEEVHILPESSSIMVRNNSLVGIGTPITFNIRSRVGGLVRFEKRKKKSN